MLFKNNLWPIVKSAVRWCWGQLRWLSARPPKEEHIQFGLQDLEVSLVLLLFLVQVGLPMMGIQQNFWGASLCWSVIVYLSLRIIWRWTGLASLMNAIKLLISIVIVGLIVSLVYGPMTKTYYTTVKPSYIYVAPHPHLVNCERRAFVIKHVGSNLITNADVVLWDNNANKGLAEHYPEVGQDTPLSPKYFWWQPSHPWDEDYTISVTTGDNRIVQHLLVRTARGKLQFASEVELNGKLVSRCRDPLLPYWYTVAANTDAPSCEASMTISDEVAQKFEPMPDNYQNPDGSLTIAKLKTLPTLPGSEGHSEARHLWEYQKTWITSHLSKYSGTRLLVLASDTGEETWKYAQELRDVFRQAHWSVDDPRKLPSAYDGIFDVQVSTDNGSPPREEAGALIDALSRSGIKQHTGAVYDPDIQRGLLVLWVGSRSPDGFDPNDCFGVPFNPKAMKGPPCLVSQVPKFCPFPPP
jgi:hypothetical protein